MPKAPSTMPVSIEIARPPRAVVGDQQLAHEREQAVEQRALEQHRAVQPERLRVGEDPAVERGERAGGGRVAVARPSPASRPGDDRRDRADARGDEEGAAPAEGDVGEARDHRAEHLPGDDREQHPADRHLALAHVVGVAEAGEHQRDQAAGEDAGDDPGREQQRRSVGAKAPAASISASPATQTWMQRCLPKRSPIGPRKGCASA